MNKISTLALALTAFSAMNVHADDFTVLTTPADVLKYSIEDVDGAKATFRAVIENTSSTAEEITAAMQAYEQTATPAPGYAFDMSFLLHYNAVTSTTVTTTELAKYWKWEIDVPAIDGSTKTIITQKDDTYGASMRIYNTTLYKADSAFGKFLAYQDVDLSAGKYHLTIDAFTNSSNCVTLSAGEFNGPAISYNSTFKNYTLDFTLGQAENIKLGLKRNSTANTALNKITFNNMYLYKVSSVIVITDDATGALAAAENVDVQLNRTFNADEYYPICLPFIVENWREVFDDLLVLNTFTDNGQLSFKTLAGANTQARKPYLVKMKESITEDSYLMFKNVTIENLNPGSWPIKDTDISMVGNWAAGTVPAGAYYLANGEWVLSDGNEPIVGFSAYINAATPLSADTLPMLINGKGDGDVSTGIGDIISTENSIVNVYNLQGIIVKRGVNEENALDGLARGIYIVNGKKIVK